jgi:hypothetical protein
MVVSAGAMVVAPRDIPHRFRNVGPGQGRFLLTIIPGRFANYFFEVAGVLDNRTALEALGAKYGVETLA